MCFPRWRSACRIGTRCRRRAAPPAEAGSADVFSSNEQLTTSNFLQMAARKVNVKFLAITIVVIGAIGFGGFVAYKFFHRRDPRKFIATGDALAKSGQLDEAAKYYATAAMLMKDPAMFV